MGRKFLLIAALLALGLAFYSFDLHHWLTLDNLKQQQQQFIDWRQQSPILVGLLFFGLYILVTGVSLPGAIIMSLAVGALFGLWWGTLIASFASSIGATIAFLVSRYLLHDWVQQRFGGRLRAIHLGMEREGRFFLLALRLVPIFPFVLINILMGLTHIRTWPFYWVSQIGMLPVTVVFVNAGTQLGQVETLSDILSPELILSFALLGLFPLLARWLLGLIKRRRAG
ncbi:TVP38/TMEM64 family protein [Microbulbifer halophilus]|uniref:TVP38/TMEM64 family membrane protein n=1 Tax=Microbulbifer halophilus TaxID=453963 RepID=A0ABW5E6T2_9GAMM|nr:TVP38/TMEM64 family protein [Microbulbifer halophilus]MCW8125671.1 TVP38/TMEM64 family protein [Microbulbifer halophilus]